MVSRSTYLQRLNEATRRSPVTALLGPRQAGKTTLARAFAQQSSGDLAVTHFDLESQPDVRRLQNPELVLGSLGGLVVIDQIQVAPQLFSTLRILVDRPENKARFLVLGSASPEIIKNVSETLAGRVEAIELQGFDLGEIDPEQWQTLWVRGCFPRSYLADSDEDSLAWREGFVRTFLERDIPRLGIAVPTPNMRRFWTMLAHNHGQTWNASAMGRAMGLSDKTVRSYLDVLTGTFMVRQLQPWYTNIGKRQVKSPRIFLRDTGLLHALLDLPNRHSLMAHPQVAASWEGFVLEQVLQAVKPTQAYFWATHSGAELDLLFFHRGQRYGIAMKLNEAPDATRSMRQAIKDLELRHVWIIYPGQHSYSIDHNLTVYPLQAVTELVSDLD
jgi:predicted AAA+ superfamily ATPase